MSITIPQGGNTAGRAASIQGLDQQPDIGGFVSQVGSAVAEKMGKIREQQRAVKYSQTELEMTKELGHEYQRVAQFTDPEQIETEWPQIEATIRDKYVNAKDENGNPLLTPEEADTLGLTLGGLSVKHGFNLGARSIELTQGQSTAAWMKARTDIVNEAATADPDTLGAFLEFGEAQIAALGNQTGKDAAWVVGEQQAFHAEVSNARLTSAITADPAAALAALEAGDYDALGAETVAARRATAQAEIDRRAAAEAKAAEAGAKARSDAMGKRLNTIADLAGKGRIVEDEQYLSDPEVQAHPDYPKAAAAIALRKEIPSLQSMTLAELDALIAEEEKRPVGETWEAERLPVLKSMREKLATERTADAKKAAIDRGVIRPETDLAFDPADPDAFADGLGEAMSQDEWLRQNGYADPGRSAIFTTEQRTALKAVLAPGADPQAKVALAGAILEGTGGNVAPVLADLEADPVFRRTVKVLGVTGDAGLAQGILRGAAKLDGKTVVAPSRKDQVMAFDAATGGVFDDNPALKAEMMEAALALYADGAKGIDGETQATGSDWLADGAAYTLYQQSVQRLLGAQPDRNGQFTIGGMQEISGGLTVLPVGVSVREVEDSWDRLTDQLNGVVYDAAIDSPRDLAGADPSALREGFAAPIPEAGDPLRAFKAASLYGGAPDLGAHPGARFNTLTLRRVGETDVYELVHELNGVPQPVPELGKDHAYRFRLTDLMREARK